MTTSPPRGPRTLRVRIMAIVALCWLLPTLVLGLYMSSLFLGALRGKTEQALIAEATHAQEQVAQNIARILDKSKEVTYDGQLTDYAARYLAGDMRYEDFYIRCRTYWQLKFQRDPAMFFTCFFLADEPETFLHTSHQVGALEAFQADTMPYLLEIGPSLDTRSRFIVTEGGLYHVRNLYNRRLERYGMLALGLVPERLLAPMLEEDRLWAGQADVLLDEYTHLANPERPFALEDYTPGLSHRGSSLQYMQQVATSDYRLTYRIELDEALVYGSAGEYLRVVLVLVLLLLPLEAVIMAFVYRTVTAPLTRLAEAMVRVADGRLGMTVQAEGGDEISRAGMAFNAMSLRIEQLIDKSYREELALRDARIAALQSRINPHFLNNALELMNWQARMDGAETVSQMIEAMSTLINAALDRGEEHMATLRAEVEVADAYFYFIRQRYGERVCVQKRLDEALLGIEVPRLIIQTLLENAVEHGIGPVGRGLIQLDIYREGDEVRIDVRNDGRPMTDAERRKIECILCDPGRDTPDNHVGLRNVNLRLRLIYGGRASLTLAPGDDGQTLARIAIPCDGGEGLRGGEDEQQTDKPMGTTNHIAGQ